MIYKVSLHGKNYEVEVEKGEAILLDVSDVPAAPVAPAVTATAPVAAAPTSASVASAAPAVSAGEEPLNAPMPGTIVAIKVAAGQQVKKGDLLLLLEAMKMENEIVSPRDATIAQIVTNQGASVNAGDPLLMLA